VEEVADSEPVTNRDALANPDCLRQYEGLEELSR
jgi:acetoacetyl-CoA synthetase